MQNKGFSPQVILNVSGRKKMQKKKGGIHGSNRPITTSEKFVVGLFPRKKIGFFVSPFSIFSLELSKKSKMVTFCLRGLYLGNAI